ncbi:MAG: hypothetical protein DMF15_04915 [Verrucomicrobia bacterium]|nr:MAG: hypothetical protein DMF15_04915 [Verrucomicrobiota bacterium]
MAHGVRHGVVQIGKGKRAMELLPVATHSVNGPHMIEYSGASMGEKELACEHMEKARGLSGSGLLTYGQLKLLPQWDPLRGDPRFEKIVASLAPKS